MPQIIYQESLTFSDVLLRPQHSTVKSRKDVDLSVMLQKGISIKTPIIISNMKSLINYKVAEEMYKVGGLCLLHRFMSLEEQINILDCMILTHKDAFDFLGCSVGVKDEDYKNVKTLYDFGVRIFCLDVAHADSLSGIEMVKFISETCPDAFLIAGNVATGSAAFRMWCAGADAVKVGIGSGSICLTRTTTGCGVPQLSALLDVYQVRLENPIFKDKFLISDGGCSKIGDIGKALAVADLVMLGNMFSGSSTIGGEVIQIDNKKYMSYVGSSTHRKEYIEGVEALVELKPSIPEILNTMHQGLASTCSYVNAHNLTELKQNAVFIKITHAGQIESGAHDVKVIK
jgi:IMP dehydrogenase